MLIDVRHDPIANSFQATADGVIAGRLSYDVDATGRVWNAYTTHVDPRFEGHGVGAHLVAALAEAARAEGAHIRPTCWFVAGWLDRHPEYGDLRPS